jgi:serralysin
VLNGGGGTAVDTLIGFAGDDTYQVNHTGDQITEAVGEGNDRVLSSVSYTLGAGVEVEQLATSNDAGTGALNLTGNEFANSIRGNAGNNILNGGGGTAADTLTGLGGDDWYFVNRAGDIVIEAAGGGSDRIFAGVSYVLTAGSAVELMSTMFNAGTDAINLTGNELANVIYGNAGNNILNGGGGTAADVLVGLAGDDTYIVNHSADRVVESAGEGADRVLASVSYTLQAGSAVERLTTTDNFGTAAIDLTGNEFSNVIYGNDGNNSLNGGGGSAADTLLGLGGDDWYFVNHAGDSVIEAAGGGNDRIFASVSYVLRAGSEVELLSTSFNPGTNAINLTGNELANVIYGNAGVNALNGGGGSGADVLVGLGGGDTLTGGLGGDRFVYLDAADAGDLVTDFTKDQNDVLDLHGVLQTAAPSGYDGTNAFSGGFLEFRSGVTDTQVLFDSTGGADSFVTLATLSNVFLQQSDTANYVL